MRWRYTRYEAVICLQEMASRQSSRIVVGYYLTDVPAHARSCRKPFASDQQLPACSLQFAAGLSTRGRDGFARSVDVHEAVEHTMETGVETSRYFAEELQYRLIASNILG